MDTHSSTTDRAAVATTVVVLTKSDSFESAVKNALPPAGYRIMRAGTVGRVVELADAGVDVAIIDGAQESQFDVSAVRSLRDRFSGFMIACAGEDGVGLRQELVAELKAVACPDMSPGTGGLVAEVERLASIRAHRRELEECEQGERDCTLRKPRLMRSFSRHRRLMLVIAAGVIVVTAIAVPLVVASLRRAKESVESGVDVTNEAINAIHRMEGYLQRDEERKTQRQK